mmetsp:Transcript_22148/g.40244  ORF Transcript_22148/g.40244 Transcript_22148/m.40244 type:complete len:114 (+) Transcript_22148:77-418(+)
MIERKKRAEKERQRMYALWERQKKGIEIEYEYRRAHFFDIRLIVPNIIEDCMDIEKEEDEEEAAIESSKRDVSTIVSMMTCVQPFPTRDFAVERILVNSSKNQMHLEYDATKY